MSATALVMICQSTDILLPVITLESLDLTSSTSLLAAVPSPVQGGRTPPRSKMDDFQATTVCRIR